MARGKAVTATYSATNPQPGYAPEPVVFVGAGGIPGAAIAAATTTNFGTVKKAATQADFAGADLAALKVELNAWLVKLKAAGLQA